MKEISEEGGDGGPLSLAWVGAIVVFFSLVFAVSDILLTPDAAFHGGAVPWLIGLTPLVWAVLLALSVDGGWRGLLFGKGQRPDERPQMFRCLAWVMFANIGIGILLWSVGRMTFVDMLWASVGLVVPVMGTVFQWRQLTRT